MSRQPSGSHIYQGLTVTTSESMTVVTLFLDEVDGRFFLSVVTVGTPVIGRCFPAVVGGVKSGS